MVDGDKLLNRLHHTLRVRMIVTRAQMPLQHPNPNPI